MFKTLGIIPSRIGSTRLPRKPLADLGGKTLIQRTYESCLKSRLLDECIVATDSEEIYQHVLDFGGKVALTDSDHVSGTSRMLEVVEQNPGYQAYLNIQGDHPLIEMEHIDALIIKLGIESERDIVVTPVVRFQVYEEVENKNVVKAVFDHEFKALYFSRSIIPFLRDNSSEEYLYRFGWKHLGLYGFTSSVISKIKSLPSSDLEIGESLEQLTWLYHGIPIYCVPVRNDVASVDTYQDLEKIRAILKEQ